MFSQIHISKPSFTPFFGINIDTDNWILRIFDLEYFRPQLSEKQVIKRV